MGSITFRGLSLSLLAVLAVVPAARAEGPAPDLSRLEPRRATSRPLAEALGADGTLRAGGRATYDATGWRMVSKTGEAPRFAPVERAEGDERWSSIFSSPGPDETIRSVAVRGHEVFVGGEFVSIGKAAARGIARWDGERWTSLGEGEKNGVDGPVYAITATDSDVYVGGTFQTAGGVTVNNVARWDGAEWHALGAPESPGVRGQYGTLVYAIAVAGTQVFAGGVFTEAGGAPASGFAVYDTAASAWAEAMGGVRQSDPEDPAYVFALALDGTSLYLGGKFERVGNVAARNIAKIDLAKGRATALGSGADDWVNEIAAGNGKVYAGGFFRRMGGVRANHVAQWNGKRWQPLASGLRIDNADGSGIRVLGLSFVDGSLYVSGYFSHAGNVRVDSAARWDGRRWSNLGSGLGAGIRVPFYGDVLAMAGNGEGVVVAGGFNTAGGERAYQLARWVPSTRSWTTIADAGPHQGIYDGFATAVAVDGEHVYVGGSDMIVGDTVAYGIAHWDGEHWATLGVGPENGIDGYLNTIEVVEDGIVVGGYFSRAGDVFTANIAKWDGTRWSGFGTGLGGGPNSQVFAITMHDGELYAGGIVSDAGGVAVNNIARWDGAMWHTVGEAPLDGVSPYGLVLSLESMDGALYAGGVFSEAGSATVANIARWDGIGWGPVAGTNGVDGVDGPVWALATDGTTLFVGGEFLTAGGDNASSIAAWSKAAGWTTLGEGIRDGAGGFTYILSLDYRDGVLYAGGNFGRAGASEAHNVAAWDGAGWSPLGSGTSSTVASVAARGDALFAAGGFALAGGRPSVQIAQYALAE